MKRINSLIFFLILLLFYSCEVNDEKLSVISGKVKRISMYDSLNNLTHRYNYFYDNFGQLASIRSLTDRKECRRVGDTVVIKTTTFSATDSVVEMEYGLLNAQGNIIRVESEILPQTERKMKKEYQTNAARELQQIDFAAPPTGYPYPMQIFDIVYNGTGYTSYKMAMAYLIDLSGHPLNDTININVSFTTIPYQPQMIPLDVFFTDFFDVFGYHPALTNQFMPASMQYDNALFTYNYILNNNNKIAEIQFKLDSQSSRILVDYY
jgi:hypothetical protein